MGNGLRTGKNRGPVQTKAVKSLLVTWKPFGNLLMNHKDFERCAVNLTIGMLAGKWKPVILQHLWAGELRFAQLWRVIPRVSKKVLLEQLRQLVADGLVERHEYAKFPPEVGYVLTPKGQALMPILRQMEQWATEHIGPVMVMP